MLICGLTYKGDSMTRKTLLAVALTLLLYSSAPAQYIDSVSTCMFHDKYNCIATNGDYLYCGGERGLHIFTQVDSSGYQFIKYCDIGAIREMEMRDNFAITVGEGFRIFDCSDPLNPNLIGSSTGYEHLAVGNNVAATSISRLWSNATVFILDISDFQNPTVLSAIEVSSSTSDVNRLYIHDNLLFVCWDDWDLPGGTGLKIYDITYPQNPVEVAPSLGIYNSTDVAVLNNYAYALSLGGVIHLIDLEDYSEIDSFDYIYGSMIEITGNYAYLPSSRDLHPGFYILDLSNPFDPQANFYSDDNNYTNSILVDNSRLYLTIDRIRDFYNTYWLSEFVIYDAIDPDQPEFLTRYRCPGRIEAVAYRSGYIFTSSNTSGLWIVDVNDPSSPNVIGHLQMSGWCDIMAIAEGYAFIGNTGDGVAIIDISDVANVYVAANYDTLGEARSLFVENGRLYETNYTTSGYRNIIADVSDPINPVTLSVLDDSLTLFNIFVRDNIGFTTRGDNFKIIDFTSPWSPTEISSISLDRTPRALFIQNDYVYINTNSDFRIFDISNLENPTYIGGIDSIYASAINIDGNYAYLSSGIGFKIVDLTDPFNPQQILDFDYTSRQGSISRRIALNNEYLIVPARYFVDILRFTPTGIKEVSRIPTDFTLSSNYPNPFNASTTISYTLSRQSQVTLDIFDILGRKVQTLYDSPQSSGEHSVIWNAEGFASGIYLYRLTASEYEKSAKMMLVK